MNKEKKLKPFDVYAGQVISEMPRDWLIRNLKLILRQAQEQRSLYLDLFKQCQEYKDSYDGQLLGRVSQEKKTEAI
jgi:hypothetical protein